MAGETWTNAIIPSDLAPSTTAYSPRFTEPQASVQEKAQYDYYEYDYDANSTAEAMSDEVLLLAKKNGPEKWGNYQETSFLCHDFPARILNPVVYLHNHHI